MFEIRREAAMARAAIDAYRDIISNRLFEERRGGGDVSQARSLN